ncbi:MAG: 4'-phosphopantetheinyl transferase family protein [Syntrophomonadales bacterium]|jgi:4'-phosphopantetheinyl transferase
MLGIYAINIEKNQDHICLPGLLQYTSSGKQRRVNALNNPEEARRVLVGDLLIRSITCRYHNVRNDQLLFENNQYGKPYLKGIENFCFNISHSGRWVACAVDHQPVGIDIEEMAPIELDVARHYFSAEEFAYIANQPESERTATFYDIWTLKESYIKALGWGLSKDLNSFTVKLIPDGKAVLSESPGHCPVYLRQYEIDKEYRLSVCAFNSSFPDRIKTVDIGWILAPIQP